MRVSERNLGLGLLMLALAGCSVRGLNLEKASGLDAGTAETVDGSTRDGHSREAALDLIVEISGLGGDTGCVEVTRNDTVIVDRALDGPVSPEDGANSPPDSPAETTDSNLVDRPVSIPDSADTASVFPKTDTGAPPDTQPLPDQAPISPDAQPVPDATPDAPMTDAALTDIKDALGDVEPICTDSIPAPDALPEPDSLVMGPDSVAVGDTAISDTGLADPPVFITSGGGRGPLSTTITTSSTSTDPVPTINNQTIRVMLRTTVAGSQVRIKLTNRYSQDELTFAAAHLAIRSSGGSIVTGSDRTLLFDGFPGVNLLARTEIWSDTVNLDVARGDTLAISLYVSGQVTPGTESGRGNLSWMIHYLSSPGDHTADSTMPAATSGPTTTHTILFVSEIGVLPAGPAATLVTLGDSITEGACSTSPNGDWPDLLSDRLPALPDGTIVSVFNAGIGSGRFASSDGAGLRGLSRLDELLLLPKVRWVTILMGVNDISYEHALASDLISAYQTAIRNAHAAGVKVIGIPILPFKGSVKDVGSNWETAQTVNDWIRSPGNGFDGIIDFEPVLGDPEHPGYLNPSLATSDKVHPNQAGYSAMANAIDLSIFQRG